MSALASVIAPYTFGPAVELANRTWAKRILPLGEVEYKGRTLRFTPEYLQGLVDSFHANAYDQVPLQLADASNTHTNDPERTCGWIDDISLRHDGLYAVATVTERGERVLSENPRLGVSARIVEQYQRSDGRHFPAAIQHVLGTLDPRIPALGAWSPVEMSNEDGGMIIDLSQASFPGDEPDCDEMTDEKLADLLDSLDDEDDDEELSDAELEELLAEVNSLTDSELAQLEDEAADGGVMEAIGQFSNAFSNRMQSIALAHAEADAEDLVSPAVRDEDRLARSLARISQSTYRSQEFASAQLSAIELGMTLAGTCAPPDALGGCSARYHALGCTSGSGDHIELAGYGAALEGLSLALHDPAREKDGIVQVPSATLELASALNESWGLHGSTPTGWDDLLSAPGGRDAYGDLARELGRPDLAQPVPDYDGYPPVSDLARSLGLK
jgi:hypothetical protein